MCKERKSKACEEARSFLLRRSDNEKNPNSSIRNKENATIAEVFTMNEAIPRVARETIARDGVQQVTRIGCHEVQWIWGRGLVRDSVDSWL